MLGRRYENSDLSSACQRTPTLAATIRAHEYLPDRGTKYNRCPTETGDPHLRDTRQAHRVWASPLPLEIMGIDRFCMALKAEGFPPPSIPVMSQVIQA